MYYKLNAEREVIKGTLEDFVRTMNAKVRVGDDTVNGTRVSTLFLSLDHGFVSSGLPIVFETCIFPENGGSEVIARYCTWDEAEHGHALVMKALEKHTPEEVARQVFTGEMDGNQRSE